MFEHSAPEQSKFNTKTKAKVAVKMRHMFLVEGEPREEQRGPELLQTLTEPQDRTPQQTTILQTRAGVVELPLGHLSSILMKSIYLEKRNNKKNGKVWMRRLHSPSH
mmetsp:Transcript_19658/g.27573  ORF Transcript_19658/g.27573 Transcript_19658/m.27573 type:complete len:107 (+) Transcript_19658:264-584(+)